MICLRSLFVQKYFASIRVGSLGALAVLLTFAGAPSSAKAQAPGTLDPNFNPSLSRVTAFAVTVDSQERVIVGGDNRVFDRYNPDGTGDANFLPSDFGGSSRIIFGLAVDPFEGEDKIIAVGKFGKGPGSSSVNVRRFNADGGLDGSFDAGTGANDTVIAVQLQIIDNNPDNDKILVGGLFTKFNGQQRGRLARLNQDGSLDESFNSGLSFNNDVYAIGLQRDASDGSETGQILVGGKFDRVNGSSVSKLVRLDIDGNVDASFNPNINGSVFAIVVQPDGKIVIGGDFDTVNGTAAKGLARLNVDGSLDGSFQAGVSDNDNKGVPPTAVNALALQENGRIIVGGNFLKLNGVTRRFIGRLESDGTLDESFDPGEGIVNRVESLAIQPSDQGILVAEVVSKKLNGSSTYPNVLRRLFGDVTLSIASIQDAVEGGQSGLFTVTRVGGDQSLPLTVFYDNRVSGKKRATNGVDYAALPGFATIPEGESTVQIAVDPIDDKLAETTEKVTLVLKPDPSYDVFVGETKATVRIFDND